ncbi:probable leucine-rich repeat receptor-like protein kinase At5g49770 isoform X2 [Magnolia sinica]|uniref:probable leucine-rich repeat receptor-like protein kinase At5g49770 isoform X2 n=1 Tax=Magnolia sinica TaxID=86752 RepID=UPI002657BE9B|nr:probable leucine-rich repeat receptor-like protein kinase At5g49770 isoform X2 [Magnolia sinica]
MRWLWWLRLPLIIITLLLAPNALRAMSFSKKQRIYTEALLAFKSAMGNPQQLSSWVGKYPCLRPWLGISCAHKLKDSTIISLWLDDNHLKGPIPVELGRLKELTSLRLAGNSLSDNLPSAIAVLPNLKELTLANNHLSGSLPHEGALSKIPQLSLHGNYGLCSLSGMFNLPACDSMFLPPNLTSLQALDSFNSRKTREAATVGGDPGIPTLTPSSAADAPKTKKPRLVAIVGGGVCAAVIVAAVVVIVYICLMRAKRSTRRASETGSSEPSNHVEWARGEGSPRAGTLSPYEAQSLRQVTFEELEHATSNFNQSNVIGEGGFGLVYKGLLQDGSIVAIKRRLQDPSQYFIQEVAKIGQIRHRHIVRLIGYCQECRNQLLVYDYLSKGNIGNHLYDAEGIPIGKLDIRQRLSIALGAAKGLDYLHGLTPPVLHMHFKTSNVLLEENYTAKVADFGLSKLLIGGYRAGPSSGIDCFLDPELNASNGFSERSDVYAFGVFLLELITGREALDRNISDSEPNLVERAKSTRDLDSFVDKTLGENGMEALRQMMELAMRCLETSKRRPTMNQMVRELELIHDREMGHQQTAGFGDEIDAVALGSDLFK